MLNNKENNGLKIIENLKIKIKEMFSEEDTGHDISHLERVFSNAVKIQQKEGGDFYVVAVSALVHDVHRIMSNRLGYFVPPEDSLDEVERLLKECDVDENKLPEILEVVKNHDNKHNKNVSFETIIIQDADALDAVGEIGLERTLKYCKTKNIPITNKYYSLDCKEYVPDINPISTCHYVYRTMIPNAKNMLTKTAKEMAKNEIKILEKFVNENIKNN